MSGDVVWAGLDTKRNSIEVLLHRLTFQSNALSHLARYISVGSCNGNF